MKRKTKAEHEQELVAYIVSVGIERWCETYDRGNWYYCFWLKNGETRHWTNLSEQSKKLLRLGGNGSLKAGEGERK